MVFKSSKRSKPTLPKTINSLCKLKPRVNNAIGLPVLATVN